MMSCRKEKNHKTQTTISHQAILQTWYVLTAGIINIFDGRLEKSSWGRWVFPELWKVKWEKVRIIPVLWHIRLQPFCNVLVSKTLWGSPHTSVFTHSHRHSDTNSAWFVPRWKHKHKAQIYVSQFLYRDHVCVWDRLAVHQTWLGVTLNFWPLVCGQK